MIAQGANYHRNYVTDLYKKANAAQLNRSYEEEQCQLHGLAFSVIVAYINKYVYYSTGKKCLLNFPTSINYTIND